MSEGPAPAAATVRYARLRVGACEFAVPAAAVVQAVGWPAGGLGVLPRRRGALAGLIEVDGATLPVVALERWVPVGAPAGEVGAPAGDGAAAADAPTAAPGDPGLPCRGSAARGRVVVLRDGALCVAVRVDALVGVESVETAARRTVCHRPDAEELFDAILPATAAGRPPLGLLEVGRLAALAAIWCEGVDLPRRAVVAGGAARPEVATERHALLVIGGRPWAVRAASIVRLAVLPPAELRWPGRRVCGIGGWAGRKLPRVDLAVAPDADPAFAARGAGGRAGGGGAAGPARGGDTVAVVTLSRSPADLASGPASGPASGLAVGLVIDRCDRMIDLDPTRIVPSSVDPLAGGTVFVDGVGSTSVLDVDRLFATVPEASLSRTAPAPVRAGAGGAYAGPAHLVFEADRRYAAPVAGVLGVLAMPAKAIRALHDGRLPLIDWRGRRLGVYAMPPPEDRRPLRRFEPRVAVVVEGGEGRAPNAIAVEALCDWWPAGDSGDRGTRRHDIGGMSMLLPPPGRHGGSVALADLARLGRRLAAARPAGADD